MEIVKQTGRGFRLGLGPVFAFEWIALSRRWQWYALRSLFATMLLLALLVILSRTMVKTQNLSFAELAKIGESFFIAVVGTQLTLVLLAAPAAAAGSICLDRASGRLTHMLVTDLSDSEIVLGKLASRLVPVLSLVGCALPLLAILTLLGGVDPDALFGAFLVTIGVAILGCSLAFFFSLWVTKTHEALLATYAIWGIWLVGRPFLALLNRSFGLTFSLPPRIADPYFLAFAPYWNRNSVTLGDYFWFLGITTGIAGLLATITVLRLRSAWTRVNIPKKKSLRGRLDRLSAFLDPGQYLPGPSLDFNPVFWREWHRGRPSRWAWIVGGVYVVGAVVASIGAIVAPRNSFAMAWVNGLQVSIGMLILSVTAATSLSEERVRGSLDVLMTTSLSTREIVIGKWLGTFSRVPMLAILPVILATFGDNQRWFYVPTVLLTLVFILICGAAITSLGLAMATWCSRLGRAVALTVTCYIFVAVGWIFLGTWGGGPDHEGFRMASPFFFAGELAADLCGGPNRDHIGWAVFWTFVYLFGALVLLGANLASFNYCLGRVESQARSTRQGYQARA